MKIGWVSSARDSKVASFRYRVEAPITALRDRGHDASVFEAHRADDYDVVVFSKAYGADHQALARQIRARGGKVVFELSDNHFFNPFALPKYANARQHILAMTEMADQVIATTDALAGVLRVETGREALVVGDAVERLPPLPRRRREPDQPWRLLWFGSHGSPNAPCGMTDLLLVRGALEALAATRPIELQVCSNSREKFEQHIAPMRIPTLYRSWSQETFPSTLSRADAVVLPISVNPFTACKTHNRLTLALYAGVPAIATGIDSYLRFAPFCTLDDWSGGLARAIDDNEGERARAAACREIIDRDWTIEALVGQWETALGLARPGQRRRPAAALAAGEPGRLRLQGHLDAVAGKAVTGWLCSTLDPAFVGEVELYLDGKLTASARADRPRPDLRRHGLPSDCGFSLPLPTGRGAALPRVSVRVAGTDWTFPGEPLLRGGGRRTPRPGPLDLAPAPPPEARAAAAETLEHQWRLREDGARPGVAPTPVIPSGGETRDPIPLR